MKLLPRHRKAAPGNSKGGVSLSDKEQLGVDSEVIQFIPPTTQRSPQALQWRGGLGIIKAFRREMFLQHWGGTQEREGAGSQAAVRRRMLRSNKPFHTEAD